MPAAAAGVAAGESPASSAAATVAVSGTHAEEHGRADGTDRADQVERAVLRLAGDRAPGGQSDQDTHAEHECLRAGSPGVHATKVAAGRRPQ